MRGRARHLPPQGKQVVRSGYNVQVLPVTISQNDLIAYIKAQAPGVGVKRSDTATSPARKRGRNVAVISQSCHDLPQHKSVYMR